MRQRIYISGRVQGVAYRFFAQSTAFRLGVIGFARNLADGRVEILAEASPTIWKKFIKALEKGSTLSRVHSVVVEPTSSTELFTTFEIRY